MIPKTIHYCWFGRGQKPKLYRECVSSWYRFCPDYNVIEWNEDNFDCRMHPYLKWCYDHHQWAFLSDFARLLILKEYGGIYLDADVEVIRPLDELLDYDAFLGYESDIYVNTGLGFGCMPQHQIADILLQPYLEKQPEADGTYRQVPCPRLNTNALIPYGLKQDGTKQQICGAVILPVEYLNPYDDATGRLRKTNKTFSIHRYGKSWMSKKTILRSKLTRPIHRLFGVDAMAGLRKKQ